MAGSSTRSLEPRARLGRGLAALLGESSTNLTESGVTHAKEVPIEFLRSNSKNPRYHFDENELDELAESIKQCGVIQPIIVRPIAGTADAYEIVAGERRWRAAQRSGRHTVPIISLQVTDREALELSIVENVQRTNLNALEEARGYSLLASEYGHSHSEIGKAVGKSRSHVANTMRLLALPEHTQDLLKAGTISAGHARALLALDDPDSVSDKIVERGLTVRDVEKLRPNDQLAHLKEKGGTSDPDVEQLSRKISLAFGVEAKIAVGMRSSSLTIRCSSSEQIEYICSKLLQS